MEALANVFPTPQQTGKLGKGGGGKMVNQRLGNSGETCILAKTLCKNSPETFGKGQMSNL